MSKFSQLINRAIRNIVCPSILKQNYIIKSYFKLKIFILEKIIYNFFSCIGKKIYLLINSYCPEKEHRKDEFVNNKAFIITQYFFQEEPSIVVLFFLAVCFSIGTVHRCFSDNSNISLELFFLILTYLWLFHRIFEDLYKIIAADDYRYVSKEMKVSDNEEANYRLRETLNAEAEAYQEEKKGYYNHIEKLAQKIHHLYKIKTNADMTIDFFKKFAKDLKYNVKIVKHSDELPDGLNAFVYTEINPENRTIILKKFSTNEKQTIQYLLHELGHAIVGAHNVAKNGLAETKSVRINRYREALRNERDANYFAAAMLCCEYTFKKKLNDTRYDLIEIMEDPEYEGLSYETIAHRTASLSEINFHAFKVTDLLPGTGKYEIMKKFSCSGLDFNHFTQDYMESSSIGMCFREEEKAYIENGIYTKISKIPDKTGTEREYFCFAFKLKSPLITDEGNEISVAYVMGCTVEEAKKAFNGKGLLFYEKHIKKPQKKD